MPYKNKEDLQAAQKRQVQQKRKNLIDYLKNHPCIICGEADPVVLDFDHVDPSTKHKTVARMVGGGTYSWARVLEEIGKCQVLCANCHRRRTHEQFGFWGYKA